MTRITLTPEDEARFRLLVAHANTEHAAIARRAFAELDALRASMVATAVRDAVTGPATPPREVVEQAMEALRGKMEEEAA